MLAELLIRHEFNHHIITRIKYDFRTADKISVNWSYRMRKQFDVSWQALLVKRVDVGFASRAWGFVSTILSVSNVHMQIGHNRKDITPKWYQDFAERFSFSSRGFQVTQAQQHF